MREHATRKPGVHRGRIGAGSLLLIAAVSLEIWLPGTALGDVIMRVDGRSINDVRITSARWDGVEYARNGQRSTVPGDQVETIERDSDVLRAARRYLARGDTGRARKEFLRLAKQALEDWEKAEAAYFVGICYEREDSPAKAKSAYEEYLAAHRENRDWWVPRAMNRLARIALAGRQVSDAQKLFGELASFGDNWKLRSAMGTARTLLAGGEPVQARNRFREVMNNRRAPAALRQEAMVGRAEVLLQQKQYANAIKDLTDQFFPRNPRTGEILYNRSRARATLLIGKAHAAQGGQENLQRAEIWFLKVTGLYRNYREEYGEAVKALVDVYTKLGRRDRAGEWSKRAGSLGISGASGSKRKKTKK